MRIKLISPPPLGITGINTNDIVLPCGIGTLTAFLRKNNIAVDQVDLNALLRRSYLSIPELQRLYRDICGLWKDQIRSQDYLGLSRGANNSVAERLLDLADITPDYALVGISIMSNNQIFASLLLAEKIKKEYNIPVVIGGPQVIASAHLYLQNYDFIDYAVAGEGETPLLKLIHWFKGEGELQEIPSLWYRKGSRVLFTGRHFYHIEDQSCPDFDGLPLELYQYKFKKQEDKLPIPYSLSRGCMNRCNFCAYRDIDGSWQAKSIKKAIRDIAFLKEKYRSDLFAFHDTNFNASYQHVEEFCDGLADAGLHIAWQAIGTLKNIDRRLLVKMAKAGCFCVYWGFESGSKKILQAMDREFDITEEIHILKMAHEVGIKNHLTLMIGYPYETIDDLKETALFLKAHADIIEGVRIAPFQLLLGTEIFKNPQRAGIKIKKHPFSFIFRYDFQEINREESERMKRELRRWQRKLFSYNLKYIVSKSARFPYNTFLYLFDLELLTPLINLLKKAYLKPGVYRLPYMKMIMFKFQYLAQYLPVTYDIIKR